jgi:hypothetical protein
VGFVPSATRVARSLKTTRSATTERERGSGEEGGIRTLSASLDSVSYRFHNAKVAGNAIVAAAACTRLPRRNGPSSDSTCCEHALSPVRRESHGGHHAIDEDERFHLLRDAIPNAPSRSLPSDSTWDHAQQSRTDYLRITSQRTDA